MGIREQYDSMNVRGEAKKEERERILRLAAADSNSNFSPRLRGAISAGLSPAEFAAQIVASASTSRANRGQAAVDRMRGRHRGLPANT